MRDPDCIEFLQWALPRLKMRWAGFRKVRGQVCKRIGRRLKELGLADQNAYRIYLENHPEEWNVLDRFCRITISRFHRDRRVFHYLSKQIIPDLVAQKGENESFRCWTAGCASGEEPYTLSILWHLSLQKRFPGIWLDIVATDSDPQLLERAESGHFSNSSIKELDPALVETAFESIDNGHHLHIEFREGVRFFCQDIRREMPEGPFDLILCRNLVFTYYETDLQCTILERIVSRLATGGVLVAGVHENLPEGGWPLLPFNASLPIFSKVDSTGEV